MRAMVTVGCWVAVVVSATGLGVSFSLNDPEGANLGNACGALLLIALLALLYRVLAQIRDAVKAPAKLREADWDAGYRIGWQECARQQRGPVVVPFPGRSASGE